MLQIALLTITLLSTASALAQPAPQGQESPTGEIERREGFRWGAAVWQSFLFVSIEHSLRFTQAKTRNEFQGKFLKDYWSCIRNIQGWGDGDGVFTNYIAHPMQGGVAGFIQIQNDPAGIGQELSRDGAYWRSRLKGMAWAAAYSTQFEIGPISEATIGHVGRKDGTAGYTDLVVTPVGGFGMTILEDAVDRFVLKKFESKSSRLNWHRFLRVALNPQRSMANLLRFKRPWHRDTRNITLPVAVAGGP